MTDESDDDEVEVERIDPLTDPEDYGLDRIIRAAGAFGVDVPPEIADRQRQIDEGIQEQTFLHRLREWFDDNLEVLNSWVIKQVVPVLVLSAPQVPGVKLTATLSSASTLSKQVKISIAGAWLGADGTFTVGRSRKIEATSGQIRRYGLLVPFVVDLIAVRGNADRGQWHRVSVGASEPMPVVDVLATLPENWSGSPLKLEASNDPGGSGAEFGESFELKTGRSAGLELPSDEARTTKSHWRSERERTTKVELDRGLARRLLLRRRVASRTRWREGHRDQSAWPPGARDTLIAMNRRRGAAAAGSHWVSAEDACQPSMSNQTSSYFDLKKSWLMVLALWSLIWDDGSEP